MAEDEALFHRWFDACPHPYLVVAADAAFTIVAANARYLDVTGTSLAAIAGRGLFEVFPDNPKDSSGSAVGDLRTSLDRVIADRRADTMGVQKYDIPRRDGSGGFEVKYWSPVNTPVFDDGDRVAYIIHHVEDITEFILGQEQAARESAEQTGRMEAHAERMQAEVMRRAAELKEANRALKDAMAELERRETELARLNQRLAELDRAKSEFFANVSHELRTPLTLIMGPLSKRLATGRRGNAEQRVDAMMLRNARLLYRHVSDLLDAAKLEAGRMTVNYARLDLDTLVRTMAAQFESLAQERHIDYRVALPSPLPAEADRELVQRILLNLLSNAFKFTPIGGRIEVRLFADEDQVVIEVADNGPGVPAALRDAVFERFRQADGGARRPYGGTGLGLAIVKELAELHGGGAMVAEAAGGGALFSIRLPRQAPAGTVVHQTTTEIDPILSDQALDALRTDDDAGRGAPSAEASPPSDAPLVLVVEDNPDMNAFIAESLRPHYRVVSAFDGREGLARALAEPPDLVLSDVMMPLMTGDEMVRELRRRPDFIDLPIIMLTAKVDEAMRTRMFEQGVHGYLNKPFAVDELLARVGALLAARQRMRQELHRLNANLAAIVQSSEDAIIGKTLDGIVTSWNPGAEKIFGYRAEEVIGHPVSMLFPPELEDEERQIIASISRGEVVSHFETTRRRKDGSLIDVAATISPIRDARGLIVGASKIARDVTGQKRLERELRDYRDHLETLVQQRTAELAAANQELESFAYAVTHDLRAPLRAMSGFAAALLEDYGEDLAGEAKNYLYQIDIARQNMSRLIDGLLALSRSTRGALKRDEVDLSALAARLLAELAGSGSGRKVAWQVEDGLKVTGDERMIEAVMRNLLDNAWKYTTGTAQPQIRVFFGAVGGRQGFCVADNGAGFDMAHSKRLFKPFQRLHRQDEFPGIGIGLATVERIIRRHGGEIWAEGRKGGGATFCFTLPPEPAGPAAS